MRCSFMRNRLDLATSRTVARRIVIQACAAAHTLVCASCRQEQRRLSRLDKLARNMPTPALPAELKAKVMAQIATEPIAAPRKGSRIMTTSLFVGASACAVALTLLLVPGSPKNGAVMADEVHKALARINSFHLKGWKLENGKKVEWEIWGRRAPFFYHERLGDFETLDNGRERYIVLAPDDNRFVKSGMILKMASRRVPSDVGWDFAELKRNNNIGQPWKRDPLTTVFSVGKSTVMSEKPIESRILYTFRNGESLPNLYETFHRQYTHLPKDAHGSIDERLLTGNDVESEWTGASLAIDYDRALPAEALAVARHPEYIPVDSLEGAKDPAVPRENAQTKNGLTLQAQPLILDRSGNIVVAVQGWFGNRSFTQNQMPFSFRSWLPDPFRPVPASVKSDFVPDPESIYCRDDQGRAYIAAQSTRLPCANGALEMWMLIPREPLSDGEALPRRISMTIFGSMEGAINIGGADVYGMQDLASDMFQIQATLPERVSVIDFDRLNEIYPRYKMSRGSGFREMEPSIPYSRAQYFNVVALTLGSNHPRALAIKKRAVYWIETALKTEQNAAMVSGWKSNLATIRKQITTIEKDGQRSHP